MDSVFHSSHGFSIIKPLSPLSFSTPLAFQNPHRNLPNHPFPMASSSSRWPSFSESDNGLASITEFSGATTHRHLFVSRTGFHTAVPRRRPSLINLNISTSSPRSIPGRIFDTRFDEPTVNPPHFLDSCSLCKKPLAGNRDIFMYRGDMPFCSEDCRTEQIEADEAMEKSRSLSSSIKALRNKQKESSSGESRKYPLRSGIAAA